MTKRDKSKKFLNDEVCLIVGMADSPHLHSWIKGMTEARVFKKILIFPSDFPRLQNVSWMGRVKENYNHVKVIRILPIKTMNFYFMHALEQLFGNIWRSKVIWYLIKRHKPSVVHYHEMQHGGYLLNPLSEKLWALNERKPVVVGSTWGSDLTFFGYIDSHNVQVQKLLNLTEILTAERSDELQVLTEYNYSGKFLAPVYISVGSKAEKNHIDTTSRPRSLILIRGYQHDQGRALNALKALEGLEEVKKFKVKIFSANKSPSVILQSKRMKKLYGIDIELLPKMSHSDFLTMYRESRLYIGLSESDGLSTSMVEAMTNGCLPIQSKNSAAPLFIEDGVSGFVVDPWDIAGIRRSICIALTDDKLFEAAQRTNIEVIANKYNWNMGVKRIRQVYDLASGSRSSETGEQL